MSFLTPEHLVRELYLKSGDRVADIGCGSGVYTLAISREVKDVGQVYAVDIHREMLQSLTLTFEKNNILNVDTVWADIEKGVNIDAYSLDAVVLSNVLFQIDDKNRALQNILKILKPGGQLLVVDWSDSHNGIGPHKDHFIKESDAENLISKNGFRVIKRLPAGKYHYAFLAISD